MKTKSIALAYLSTLFIFISCNNENRWRELNKEFIAKYGNETFDEFKNRHFLVRGFDKENPIVFVYDDQINDSSPCRLFYGVVVNVKESKIVSINKSALDDSCIVDEPLSQKLAIKFAKYNITLLAVDSNNCVFIKTIYKEGPFDLIRFSNPRYLTEGYKKNWKPKGNGWYERISFK